MSGDSDIAQALSDQVAAHLGSAPVRASASFLGVDTIDVLRFTDGDDYLYVTVGMYRTACVASGSPGATTDGASGSLMRGELVLRIRRSGRGFADVWRSLAVLAAAPVVEQLQYVADMTVDLGQSLAGGSLCSGVVVGRSAIPDVELPDDRVRLMEVLPVTRSELAWCRDHGAAALRELWVRDRVDLTDLGRPPVEMP